MDKARCKSIRTIVSKLTQINHQIKTAHKLDDNILSEVESLKGQIQEIVDEEQESFDNMPAGLQNSDRGETSQAAIDALENAISEADMIDEDIEVDELKTTFDTIVNSLEEATA